MKPKPFSALNHFTVPVAIANFPPRALCRSRFPGPIVAVFVVRSRLEQSAPPAQGRKRSRRAIHSNYGMETTPNRPNTSCLLYTSDAADDLLCVDLGGRR